MKMEHDREHGCVERAHFSEEATPDRLAEKAAGRRDGNTTNEPTVVAV
jgi:hypothetical protein